MLKFNSVGHAHLMGRGTPGASSLGSHGKAWEGKRRNPNIKKKTDFLFVIRMQQRSNIEKKLGAMKVEDHPLSKLNLPGAIMQMRVKSI